MPYADRNQRLEYLSEYHKKNPDRRSRTEYQRGRRDEVRSNVQLAKSRPCADCGVRYPYYVMDFDHRPEEEKVIDINRAISKNWTWRRIWAEIQKCDVVCANCHRHRTMMRIPEGTRQDWGVAPETMPT